MNRKGRLAKLRTRLREFSTSLELSSDRDLDALERLLAAVAGPPGARGGAWLAAADPEFWEGCAAELRRPLSTMLGFADLLLDARTSEEERRGHVEAIRRNGAALSNLIETLDALAKMETGGVAVELRECWLSELLEEVLAVARPRAAEKAVDISLEYLTRLPASVRTDPQHLRRILTNLIEHAVKSTASGTVLVRVGFESEQGKGRLGFEVIAAGAAARLGRELLVPFRYTSSGPARYGDGRLGLPISAALTSLLGGELRVHESSEEGAAFALRVPIGVERATAMVDQPSVVAASLLLALEPGEARERLAQLLRRAGHEVTVVENGRVAADLVMRAVRASAPFDMAVLDLQLAELDGCDAATLLRAEAYQGLLIGFSARGEAGDRERCLGAGCDGYLDGRSGGIELLDLVRDLLEFPPPTISVPAPALS